MMDSREAERGGIELIKVVSPRRRFLYAVAQGFERPKISIVNKRNFFLVGSDYLYTRRE